MSRQRMIVGFHSKPTSFKKIFEEILKNNGFECKKLYYENDTYYCVRDILKCLKYGDESYDISIIIKKLKNLDKFTIDQLQKKYNYTIETDPNRQLLKTLNQYQMKHIYINNQGMNTLLISVIKPVPDFLLGMCRVLNIDINKNYIKKEKKMLKKNRLSNL